MAFSRNARNNSVWLPAPAPLDCLLITECAELADITDNSIQLGDSIYCRNPNTGKYEFYTKLDARPEDSDGSISIPMETARFVQKLRRQGCPVPLQLRSYSCETPATNINGWDEIMHLRNVLFEVQTFSNLTSQLENDDAVPTVQVNYEFSDLDFITKDIAGYHDDTGINTVPISVSYCDSPSCGACNGFVSDGCSRMYGLWYDTVATETVLKTTADGGVTWTDITPAPAITGVPADLVCAGGRLFLAVGTEIYYNDTPLDAGGWLASSVSAVVATSIVKFASTGSLVYALYDSSGVLLSEDFGVSFDAVLLDAELTAEQQNDIDVAGRVVATGGDNDTVQISQELGEANSWQLKGGIGASASDDLIAIDVAKWNLSEDRSAVLYAVVDDTDGANTGRLVYKSIDLGNSWEVKERISGSQGTTPAQIESTLDSWVVYVNTDETTRKSIDGGCTWFDISNSSVTTSGGTTGTRFALCDSDINEIFVTS